MNTISHHSPIVRIFIPIGTVVLLILIGRASADESTRLKNKFLADYTPHASALRERYSNIRYSCEFVLEVGGKQIQKTLCEGQFNHDNFSSKETGIEPKSRPTYYVRNSKYVFSYYYNRENQILLGDVQVFKQEGQFYLDRLCVPYGNRVSGRTYLDIVREEDTEILEYNNHKWNGIEVKRLKMRLNLLNAKVDKKIPCVQELFFSPNRGWICVGGGTPKSESVYQYEDSPQHFPALKRTEVHMSNPDDPNFTEQVHIHNITEFESIPPLNDADFRLTALGFPEPEGVEWKKPTPRWQWWLLAGIGSALICLLFFYLMKRAKRSRKPQPTEQRPALTLLELLVAIAVIGILIALLLPAVQKVRETADRTNCAHKLRQIGMATHQHNDERGALPAGMSYFQGFLYSSWLLHLLPYVEQESLWSNSIFAYGQAASPFQNPPHFGLATVIPLYTCPSDSRTTTPQFAPRSGYYVAFTSYLGVAGTHGNSEDGVLYRDSQVRLSDIADGTSNTLLVGERPPSNDFQYGWWYAGVGQNRTGSLDVILGVREENHLPSTRESCPAGIYPFRSGRFSNPCDKFHFWSPHSSGANFVFADVSVHFLKYSANSILPALATRAEGDAASGW